ncbi:MAG: prepilin-type N-terminal cleavage/methylation domain-containing protein [Alcaligenaceae bacterium]|nr:MAG: prepilin-type N-terminal cleavage/methylation domain-containing protein [Alcaligenaceae bacterium]
MLRFQRGLTAIELLVTIAILAILIGIAAPSLTQFVAKWRVSNALNALTGSLRLARTEAIARSRHVVLYRVDSDTSTTCQTGTGTNGFASGWIVFVDVDVDDKFSTGDELLLRQVTLSGMSSIEPPASTTLGTFQFYANGIGSKALGFNIDATGFDTTSTTPWARKAMCIGKTGRIRYVADASNCNSSTG